MPPIPLAKKPMTRKQKREVIVKVTSRILSRVLVHKLLVRMGAPKYVAYSVAMINVRLVEIADPVTPDEFIEALGLNDDQSERARQAQKAAAKRS